MACEMISLRDFRIRVLNDEPSVVAFTAKSCEHSQKLLPIMDEVSEKFDGRVFAVDFGEGDLRARAARFGARYGVNRLPAVVAFSDGRPKDLIGGLTSAEDIADMLDRQMRPVRDVIGSRNFRVEVLESKKPVLVHFHSASCGGSESLIPTIDEVARKFSGRATVVRVEVSPFNAAVMERYGAIRTPMLAAFEDGDMKDTIMGTIVDTKRLGAQDGVSEAVDHVSEMLEALL
jgi:thioredoxin 1